MENFLCVQMSCFQIIRMHLVICVYICAHVGTHTLEMNNNELKIIIKFTCCANNNDLGEESIKVHVKLRMLLKVFYLKPAFESIAMR